MKTRIILLALLFCTGCVVRCNPTYTPTGSLGFENLGNMPVELKVIDGRGESEKVFFKRIWGEQYWDINAKEYNQYQPIQLEVSSCEILKNSLEKAMTDYGYKLVKDAPIAIDVTLRKYLHVCDTWAQDYSGRVFADIQFDVSVRKNGLLLAKKRISGQSEKNFDPFRQFQDAEPLLSDCLSKAVEKIVSDNEVLNAVKKGYVKYIPEGAVVEDEGEAPIPSVDSEETPKQVAASQGTGFLLSESGLVATNYHVVSEREDIRVFFPKTDLKFDAKVELKDISNDLVILRLKDFTYEEVFSQEIPYDIQKSKTVKLGEKVFTLGFPLGKLLGKSAKFSDGTISSLSGLMGTANLFQINNPIQPGNSGGPLFDQNGNVVGIVLASLDAKFFYENLDTIPQNVNFAIKSDYLISLISMLPENDSTLSRKGSLQDKTTEEQVDALIPYIVTIYVR